MSSKSKPTKKDSMFSKENIHRILNKVINPETRCSQRNINRGINKRGVDSHSSRRSQPGPSDQPQATCERYGDPDVISAQPQEHSADCGETPFSGGETIRAIS